MTKIIQISRLMHSRNFTVHDSAVICGLSMNPMIPIHVSLCLKVRLVRIHIEKTGKIYTA